MLFRIELEMSPRCYLLWVAFTHRVSRETLYQPLWCSVSDPGPLDADV